MTDESRSKRLEGVILRGVFHEKPSQSLDLRRRPEEVGSFPQPCFRGLLVIFILLWGFYFILYVILKYESNRFN